MTKPTIPVAWGVFDAADRLIKSDADRTYIEGELESFSRYTKPSHGIYGPLTPPFRVEPLYRRPNCTEPGCTNPKITEDEDARLWERFPTRCHVHAHDAAYAERHEGD